MTTLCADDLRRDLSFTLALEGEREAALIAISRAQRLPMKPTCGPDDGSNAGPWITEPAHEIDGADKRVLRAAEGVRA